MNRTEQHIQELLSSIPIKTPDDLNIDTIANTFNIDVRYWGFSSELVSYKKRTKIFINRDQSPQAQWQDFCHEFTHYSWHVGDQRNLPFSFYQLQENQANYATYHLAVPTFMLERARLPPSYFDAIRMVCNTFNVEPKFAFKRLEMYRNKQLSTIMNY